MFGEQGGRHRAIGKIDLDEAEPRILAQDVEPSRLERGIVVAVEVVDSDNRASLLQEPGDDMKSDEPRRAGDQYRVIRYFSPQSIPSSGYPGRVRSPAIR
jgi:hypothetical protein